MNESLVGNANLYHRMLGIDSGTAQRVVQAQQLEVWERTEGDWQVIDIYKAAMSKVMTKLGVTSDPETMSGEPVLAGTRVPVSLILGELSSGRTKAEILSSYPTLPADAVGIATRYGESLPADHPLAQLFLKYRALCH